MVHRNAIWMFQLFYSFDLFIKPIQARLYMCWETNMHVIIIKYRIWNSKAQSLHILCLFYKAITIWSGAKYLLLLHSNTVDIIFVVAEEPLYFLLLWKSLTTLFAIWLGQLWTEVIYLCESLTLVGKNVWSLNHRFVLYVKGICGEANHFTKSKLWEIYC